MRHDRNPLPSDFSSHSLIDHPISEKRRTGVIIILMHLACRQNGTAYIHNLFQLKALSKVFLIYLFILFSAFHHFSATSLRPVQYLAACTCVCAHGLIYACACMHTCACWCQLWHNDRLTVGATTPPQASRKALHSWAASCESEHRLQVKTRSREPPLF